jgi:ADP-ribose pyrophosphatase YjhB (NUDIX family)
MTQFESDEATLQKIAEFFTRGFDQMRILGGTSLNEEHYGGVFFVYYDKATKKMYFLAVPYNSSFHKGNDSNGHTKKQGATPKETTRREGFEEGGLLSEEQHLIEVYSYSVPNRRDRTKIHSKHFYYAEEFSGTLSDFGYEPNPIDGETSTPLWLSAKLFKKVLYGGHQEAFKAVVEHLMAMNLEYYYALCDL